MRVLVACEFSGIVREAFTAAGCYALSCDLLDTEIAGRHYKGPVQDIINEGWHLMIAHPPCTHLAVSGARWFKDKIEEQARALAFVRFLLSAPVDRICLENPVSIISTQIRKPDQIIQPWQYGHPETKKTCLWLKGLQALLPTNIVEPDYMRRQDGTYYRDKKGKRYSRIHYMSGRGFKDKAGRSRERSRSYTGVAAAMAEQWGKG